MTRAEFGLDEVEGGANTNWQFEVTNKYVWTKKQYKLPIRVNFEFKFMKDGEFIPAFSHNRRQWGQPNPDALSMYLGTKRNDFTFRTGLFKSFPSVKRPNPGFNANIN